MTTFAKRWADGSNIGYSAEEQPVQDSRRDYQNRHTRGNRKERSSLEHNPRRNEEQIGQSQKRKFLYNQTVA